METVIARVDPVSPDPTIINKAGDIIRSGGLVAFPTETVYGLGGDALSGDSSAKIYAAKGRPSDNPLIVHIADMSSLDKIVRDIPDEAYLLADRFWPGPLTMIMDKSDAVPYKTTGGLDTVAVRFPSDPVAQSFIRASGGYIAAPSANLSGRPSPTSGEYVVQDMNGRIDMILYGDDSLIGLESTIVDMTEEHPVILRPGFITLDMLNRVIPGITLDAGLAEASADIRPKAPGMKYRHYAPRGEMTIVEGSAQSVIDYINEKTAADKQAGFKTAVIASELNADRYSADIVMITGGYGDETAAAHNLFKILRRLDDEDAQRIYAESFEDEGLGAAIMNRLVKAAGHNIIHL